VPAGRSAATSAAYYWLVVEGTTNLWWRDDGMTYETLKSLFPRRS
jgi:hypothetical protein